METKVSNIIRELISKYGEATVSPYVSILQAQELDLEVVESIGNARIENGRVVVDAVFDGRTVKANLAAA